MYAMQLPRQPEPVDAALLPELFEHYLEERTREGQLSALTVQSYRVQIRPFFVWFEEQPQKVLSPVLLGEYALWLRHEWRTTKGEKASSNTYNHALDRLRSLLIWCFKQQCIPVSIAEWLPRSKARPGKAYFADTADLQKVFASVRGVARFRDWALFALLISTGARIYEIAHASAQNITFNSPINDLRVTSDHRGTLHLRKVKFDSEGEGEGRTIVFCTKAGLLLKLWLISSDNQPHEPLFGLSPDGLMKHCRSVTANAGIAELTPHGFRRSFADHWDATHELQHRTILKHQLGHSTKGDVTETHYLRKNHKRIAAAIMSHHVSPMEEITIDWATLPVQCND